MQFLSYAPGPPLADFVDRIWFVDDASPQANQRILPSGTLELAVNLREDANRFYEGPRLDRCVRYSGAIVSGAFRQFFAIDTRVRASVIGVHFRPGGAFAFLGAPARLLADTHVDLDALWGPGARELRERLCAAATAPQRFALLERALLARLARRPRRHVAVPFALASLARPGAEVGQVVARVGMSHRRFNEVFSAEVGLTPKLFERVSRFQRVLARAGRLREPDWGQLAVDCGYFDQSHLIRDFVVFSGLTPSEYLRRRGSPVLDHHAPLSPKGVSSIQFGGVVDESSRRSNAGSDSSNTPRSAGPIDHLR